MQAIGVYANTQKPDVLPVSRLLLQACNKVGLSVILEPWLHNALGDLSAQCDAQIGHGTDALVVLGGDGTLLRAMPYAVKEGIPLFGINLGRVGFLTEVDPQLDPESDEPTSTKTSHADALEQAMRALHDGAFTVENRMLLSVNVPGQPERLALNDAVINRDAAGGLLSLEAHLGDVLIDRYMADGLIVSTPTGSTAYSLSAGGPIVSPDVACMVLSPICPHSLRARTMVFSADSELRIFLHDVRGADSALLTTDGQFPASLTQGAEILIRRANVEARFIRLQKLNFFTLMRAKLSEWSI